ncbi:MAG: class I SAM-dependent methyltransferase [Cyclobacteriaceae bacterium]|nr:class I SAM-dependent methyltransferase [Cyclobacteriaceae bacterium]
MIQIREPQHWQDYELIDSGNFQKLERFGQYILSRPEPQAVWDPALPLSEWNKADAVFIKEKSKSGESGDRGKWQLKPGMPDRWFVNYQYKGMKISFRLALTGFKHVGLFPEQAENWNFLYDHLKAVTNMHQPKVLNLFAYTGGASLAACAAGADVTHVDSVKPVLNWANENMQSSGLQNIRWVLEDAMKFVKREVKRGRIYQGIILDPPAYGRGPTGEKWVLEEGINELMQHCASLLESKNAFFILNLYSMGLSALVAEGLTRSLFKPHISPEYGELYKADHSGRKLPLGVFCRFSSGT